MRKIKNLALGGGGFYGFAEVGALKELDKYSDYFDIQNISGVSVGSMVAALYAVGYNSTELTEILQKMDFDELIRDKKSSYLKLWNKFGMYDAKALEDELERLIRIKTNIKFCTFSQIKKNLIIISTNLNYQKPYFLSRETTPLLAISKAIRMSISYPMIMTPVLYQGDFYGDGGESINYPICVFEDKLDETIGITFAAHNENNNGTLKSRITIDDIYDYVRSIAVTMNRSTYVSQITDEQLSRSIIVNITEKISSMQFKLTPEQKQFIYDCGIKSTSEQIKKILNID